MSITPKPIDYTAGGGFVSGIFFTPWESSLSKSLSQPPVKVTDTKRAEVAFAAPLSPSYPSAASSTDTSPALSSAGSNSSAPSPASSDSSVGDQKAATMAPLVLAPSAPQPKPILKPHLKKVDKFPQNYPTALIPSSPRKTLICVEYLSNNCRFNDMTCKFAHGEKDLKVRDFVYNVKSSFCANERPPPGFPPGMTFACPSISCPYGHAMDRIQPYRTLVDANGVFFRDRAGKPMIEWLVTTVRNQIKYPVCMISQADAEKLNIDAIFQDPSKPLPINFK